MQSVIEKTESRIDRLLAKYRSDIPAISTERAKFFTEKWKETESSGLPAPVRIALSMKHVYENMTFYLDPDDRIAGYWTEYFLGMPLDIERGVFNTVLETELSRGSILAFRIKSFAGTFSYLLKKRGVREFVRNARMTRASGPQPMNLGLDTMSERKINPFVIDPDDKTLLLNELLTWWKGKTVVDELQREINDSGMLGKDMRDFNLAMPANTSRQTMMISTCSTISTYQGHVILDFENVLSKGLEAMAAEVQARLDRGGLSDAERAVVESMRISIEGVSIYARRLAERIERGIESETDAEMKAELGRLLDVCRAVPLKPARSFREAVQSAWTIKTAVELAHPVNLHCFGRMDQILFPYYEKDIREGAITRDEARELLDELLLKVMSQNIRPESNILSGFYHRFLGSTPVTIGGVKPDGSDATNELTYVFLDAAKSSRAVTNVSIRVHSGTPDDLLLRATEVMHAGCSNLSFFNDDVNVEAMQRRGFEPADARDYAVMGCVEMLCPGKTGGMSANALLLCRLLDIFLRNGDSQTLIAKVDGVGLKTGDPDSFETFESFTDAFVEQAKSQIKLLADASNVRDRLFAERLPAPYISAFMGGCLDSAKDVTSGGAAYDLSGISFINSIANLVDSLHVINKLVFEKREMTVAQLMEAINRNFEGHEDILKKIKSVPGRWGNGDPEVDALARGLTTRLFEETYKYKSYRGGVFVPYVISMTTHTIDGRISIASPDGRAAATPYAASCNPYNVERNGVTAAMISVAALDYKDVLGCAVNMRFHPTAVGDREETRRKWIALLRTYFKLGGQQLQPTVASAEMLRAAQKDPDSYRDLSVKVGGYSTYFVDLGIEIQNEVIARTEHSSAG
ncbi:MAG: pyruvate formate lyase family protein [bacterium]